MDLLSFKILIHYFLVVPGDILANVWHSSIIDLNFSSVDDRTENVASGEVLVNEGKELSSNLGLNSAIIRRIEPDNSVSLRFILLLIFLLLRLVQTVL